MAQNENPAAQLINKASLIKRMIVGTGIGLVVISMLLLSAGDGDPAWGALWRIRPLVIVPLAGAAGGFCSYFMITFHYKAHVNKIVAMILSVFVFIIGLWMGIVLGLDGTMWN